MRSDAQGRDPARIELFTVIVIRPEPRPAVSWCGHPPPVDTADSQLFINRELSLAGVQRARARGGARRRRCRSTSGSSSSPSSRRTSTSSSWSASPACKQQLAGGVGRDRRPTACCPPSSSTAIAERAHAMVAEQDRACGATSCCPLLARARADPRRDAQDSPPSRRPSAKTYFTVVVFPALTPLAVDPGHPFPHLRNKSLNLAVAAAPARAPAHAPARRSGRSRWCRCRAVLSRLVPLPADEAGQRLRAARGPHRRSRRRAVPRLHASSRRAAFRVTRNWDLDVDEEESEDLLSTIQEELRRRDRGAAVRLELDRRRLADARGAAPRSRSSSTPQRRLPRPRPAAARRPDGARRARPAARAARRAARARAAACARATSRSIFDVIAKRDMLLHHPYESFDPVVRFIEEAADDPQRAGDQADALPHRRRQPDRPRALARAAENGKQVAVLVELKARFDEANNIAWARRLEEAGVHVVYGLIGLKTHCKVALVVRREGDGIRRYVHLGTGNYNPTTARQYTDLSLFTARAGDRPRTSPRCSTCSPATRSRRTGSGSRWRRSDLHEQVHRADRPRGGAGPAAASRRGSSPR